MKKCTLRLLLLLTISILNSYILCAQSSSSLFSYEKYISKNNDTLLYRQLWPDSDTLRRFPLVIFLHGSGERGNDNEAQLKWGVQNFANERTMLAFPAIVIAPQCPRNTGWGNFSGERGSRNMKLQPTPTKPMQLLYELIQKAKRTLPVDSTRIYITGLSMGGFGTFDAMQRYPNLFAAAVPVCGGGDVSGAPVFAHIPTWIFHGALDVAVDPLFSVDMINALYKAGARPGFTLYPEVGHFSWLGAYTDTQMMQWLFRQVKRSR